jgi:hypothetical protein
MLGFLEMDTISPAQRHPVHLANRLLHGAALTPVGITVMYKAWVVCGASFYVLCQQWVFNVDARLFQCGC